MPRKPHGQGPRKQIPLDTLVQHDGEPHQEHFLVDETLTVTMSNGRGVSLGLRLSPQEALDLAEHLRIFATFALESGELSSAETVGTA